MTQREITLAGVGSALRLTQPTPSHAPCPFSASCACPTTCNYAELWIWQRPRVDPERTAHEFISMMRDGQPPERWRETWPEILRVEKAGKHPRRGDGDETTYDSAS
jgi:hypothetical protein